MATHHLWPANSVLNASVLPGSSCRGVPVKRKLLWTLVKNHRCWFNALNVQKNYQRSYFLPVPFWPSIIYSRCGEKFGSLWKISLGNGVGYVYSSNKSIFRLRYDRLDIFCRLLAALNVSHTFIVYFSFNKDKISRPRSCCPALPIYFVDLCLRYAVHVTFNFAGYLASIPMIKFMYC